MNEKAKPTTAEIESAVALDAKRRELRAQVERCQKEGREIPPKLAAELKECGRDLDRAVFVVAQAVRDEVNPDRPQQVSLADIAEARKLLGLASVEKEPDQKRKSLPTLHSLMAGYNGPMPAEIDFGVPYGKELR